MYISPHKKDNNHDINNTFNFNNEDRDELDNYKTSLQKILLQNQNNSYGEILSILLWNSMGKGNGFAECRKLINQAIIRDIQPDLYITQEPVYTTEENYLKCFNLTSDKYEITYPPNKKSREQVAIIFNKTKLLIEDDGHKDTYSLVEESRSNSENGPGIEYITLFPIYGKARVQIVHFKLCDSHDSICIFNFHSIYNGYKVESRVSFVLEFFKFVNWYIYVKNKNNNLKVLIVGDFNFDIMQEEIEETVHLQTGLKLLVPSSPSIDNSYDEEEISKTNIDYFCTIYDKNNYINITQVSKLPIRFINYYQDFPDIYKLIKLKNINISKISTHDPQHCYITFEKNYKKTNDHLSSSLGKLNFKDKDNNEINYNNPINNYTQINNPTMINTENQYINNYIKNNNNNCNLKHIPNINDNSNNINESSYNTVINTVTPLYDHIYNNPNDKSIISLNFKKYYFNFNFNISIGKAASKVYDEHCGFSVNRIPLEYLPGHKGLRLALNSMSGYKEIKGNLSKKDYILKFIKRKFSDYKIIQDIRNGSNTHNLDNCNIIII